MSMQKATVAGLTDWQYCQIEIDLRPTPSGDPVLTTIQGVLRLVPMEPQGRDQRYKYAIVCHDNASVNGSEFAGQFAGLKNYLDMTRRKFGIILGSERHALSDALLEFELRSQGIASLKLCNSQMPDSARATSTLPVKGSDVKAGVYCGNVYYTQHTIGNSTVFRVREIINNLTTALKNKVAAKGPAKEIESLTKRLRIAHLLMTRWEENFNDGKPYVETNVVAKP